MRNKYNDVRKLTAEHTTTKFPGVLAPKQLQHCRPHFGISIIPKLVTVSLSNFSILTSSQEQRRNTTQTGSLLAVPSIKLEREGIHINRTLWQIHVVTQLTKYRDMFQITLRLWQTKKRESNTQDSFNSLVGLSDAVRSMNTVLMWQRDSSKKNPSTSDLQGKNRRQ